MCEIAWRQLLSFDECAVGDMLVVHGIEQSGFPVSVRIYIGLDELDRHMALFVNDKGMHITRLGHAHVYAIFVHEYDRQEDV